LLFLNLRKCALQRFDQALHIGAESLVGQTHGVAPGQRLKRRWQLVGSRHHRVTDQHRNHPFALRKRRLDFNAHEIVGILEPPFSGAIARIDPALADHRQKNVAFTDALVQHADEIETRCDIVNVQKQLLRMEYVLQPVKKTAGIAGIVAAAVINEYLARHSDLPHGD
jgi:hypothetical protein